MRLWDLESMEAASYQAHPGGTAGWGEDRLGVERTEQGPLDCPQREEVLSGGRGGGGS